MRDGFWSHRVTAFFDVRVTHVNSKTNQGKPTPAVLEELESENKYQRRVLKAEMSSFNPIIVGTNAGMSKECKMFMRQLAENLADKDVEGSVKSCKEGLRA